jgi:hypothetical protein
MDIIERLWKDSFLFITRDEFEISLLGWTIDPVYSNGEVAAVFLVNGPKFHFAKFDHKLQAGKAILRKYPGELIAKYGYAETSTPKEDSRQLRFNRRLGFFVTSEDEFDFHLRIEKMRYGPISQAD